MVRREQPDYLSYLLRLWQVGSQSHFASAAGQVKWRASLESPHTSERWSFASLDELFAFLQVQTSQSDEVEVTKAAHLELNRETIGSSHE